MMSPYLHRPKVSRSGALVRLMLVSVSVFLAARGTRNAMRGWGPGDGVKHVTELPVVMLALGFVLGRVLTADERRVL